VAIATTWTKPGLGADFGGRHRISNVLGFHVDMTLWIISFGCISGAWAPLALVGRRRLRSWWAGVEAPFGGRGLCRRGFGWRRVVKVRKARRQSAAPERNGMMMSGR
jgi:hypothetical protein